LDPRRNEAADGQAVIKWMREQPWYTGSFTTLGASYIGYAQWALLSETPPPDMRAAAVYIGLHDMTRFISGTGALGSSAFARADFATRKKRGDSQLSLILSPASQQAALRPIFDSPQIVGAANKYFQDRYAKNMPSCLEKNIVHPDLADEYWRPLQHEESLEKANLPIFPAAGWYDLILHQVI
jgi:uncharacterized protein